MASAVQPRAFGQGLWSLEKNQVSLSQRLNRLRTSGVAGYSQPQRLKPGVFLAICGTTRSRSLSNAHPDRVLPQPLEPPQKIGPFMRR